DPRTRRSAVPSRKCAGGLGADGLDSLGGSDGLDGLDGLGGFGVLGGLGGLDGRTVGTRQNESSLPGRRPCRCEPPCGHVCSTRREKQVR
ncbi:hypothetical protein JL919_18780, partial [Acinetobacter baumannii]|nr:hypothetical protein [Acinetobacter baumannii]